MDLTEGVMPSLREVWSERFCEHLEEDDDDDDEEKGAKGIEWNNIEKTTPALRNNVVSSPTLHSRNVFAFSSVGDTRETMLLDWVKLDLFLDTLA